MLGGGCVVDGVDVVDCDFRWCGWGGGVSFVGCIV